MVTGLGYGYRIRVTGLQCYGLRVVVTGLKNKGLECTYLKVNWQLGLTFVCCGTEGTFPFV